MKQRDFSRFNNISLYRKILTIVLLSILSICITFLISIQILSAHYDEELYRTNANALNHVISSIEAEMQIIETVSANIISNTTIQDNLIFLADNQDGNRLTVVKRDIYEQLYSYISAGSYIKSINITLSDGSVICMGSSDDILKFDFQEMNQTTISQQGRITWFPSINPGNTLMCGRQIRQIKYFNLRNLAGLYITVDYPRMMEDALMNSGYPPESSRFVIFADDKRIYPETGFHDDYCLDLISDPVEMTNTYQIATFDQKKEFIITGSFRHIKWNYIYFRDYNPLFEKLRSVRLQLFVSSLLITAVMAWLVNLIFRHIFRHLDYLIEKIQSFGQGAPVPQDSQNYDYTDRKDEIGQLHRSFDEMTHSVKVLRDENYDKQLLLRDATIKRLQQQINPHFLYNTLDTINWMSQKYGADDISIMVQSLANLFRMSITGQEDLISLKEELAVLDDYIKIQRIRFRDRLIFELNLPEQSDSITVPKLCIQPLVENALKHAMEYTSDTCTIRVSISEHDQDYRIKVANTGSQFEEDLLWKLEHKQITPQGSGVGLVNINSRLKLIYGDRYGLTFYNNDGMAVVMLSIPKEQENAHA